MLVVNSHCLKVPPKLPHKPGIIFVTHEVERMMSAGQRQLQATTSCTQLSSVLAEHRPHAQSHAASTKKPSNHYGL